MSNRNNQIVEPLLSVLSKELDLSMDDLRLRCDVDEVALEVDRYIAEHPEKFGMVPTSNEEIDPDSFTHWLDILRNDQSFIETMNDILNM